MSLVLPFGPAVPKIADSAWLAETATIIGDVEIGAESSVWYGTIVRGDVFEIRIGQRTNIQDGTVIHVADGGPGTYIGDEVTIGHMAMLHACRLEDQCFVGMRATVMDGSIVESGAMVAAGALVTPGKRVLSGQLWAGAPARYMRQVSEMERRLFVWSAQNYVDVAAQHRSRDGQLRRRAQRP